ncbi:MAG TPA: calcium-binding protein [Methylibium sp.]|nr:calcium-binding protein [Methylibium sp.]
MPYYTTGTDAAELLTGYPDAEDDIFGAGGNDTLVGGALNDTLDGGDGIDTADYGDDSGGGFLVVDLAAGTVTNSSFLGGSVLWTDQLSNIEVVIGSSMADRMLGSAGAERLDGSGGDDTIDGGAGNDTLVGGAGIDLLSFASAAAGVIANLGNAVIVANGADQVSGFEGLIGSAHDDRLTGTAGDNTLIGGDGNDTLIGSGGNDSIAGGDGDDRVVIGAGNATLWGGEGSDWLDFSTLGVSVSAELGSGSVTTAAGTLLIDGFDFENVAGSVLADTLRGGIGENVLEGRGGNDLLTRTALSALDYGIAYEMDGGAGNDTVEGSGGSDTIHASGGNDLLDGGVDDILVIPDPNGPDEIISSNGFDTLSFERATGSISYNGHTGRSSGGGTGSDTVSGFEGVIGSDYADTITGGNDAAVSERLRGAGGNDSVSALGGHDYLYGGAGNDTLAGGVGNDFLYGDAGDDSLLGGDGNDQLFDDDETGLDILLGGAGDDEVFLLHDGPGQLLDGGSGVDTLNLSAMAPAFVQLSLQAMQASFGSPSALSTVLGFESVIGTGGGDSLEGNAQANRLDGADGDDVLQGGAGSDTLVGGLGSNTLVAGSYFDGGVPEAGVIDYASYAGFAAGVRADLGNNPSGGNVLGSAWSDSYLGIRGLIGTDHDDRLLGNADTNHLIGGFGDDVLYGRAGDDTLDGGGTNAYDTNGEDLLVGGAGDDLYIVNGVNVLAIESSAGGGIDTVRTALNGYVLGSLLENLELAGNGGINGSGNELDNVITGNAFGNAIDGGAGRDTASYANANVAVTVSLALTGFQNTGYGNDRLQRIENLLGSSRADTLTGNDAANRLDGGLAADTLSGGAGHDTLVGGAGNDSLAGGAGLDAFRFTVAPTASGNVDRIVDFDVADDRLEFDVAAFAALGGTGALAAGAFVVGAAAADADDRLIYTAGNGRLYYDADGNGAGAQLLIAQLGTGLALTAADFFGV